MQPGHAAGAKEDKRGMSHAPEVIAPLLHWPPCDNLLKADASSELSETHFILGKKILALAIAGHLVDDALVREYIAAKLAHWSVLVQSKLLEKLSKLVGNTNVEKAEEWLRKCGVESLSEFGKTKMPSGVSFETWKNGTDLLVACAVRNCVPLTDAQKAEKAKEDDAQKTKQALEEEKQRSQNLLAELESEKRQRSQAEELVGEKKRRLEATEMRMAQQAMAMTDPDKCKPDKFLCSVFICENKHTGENDVEEKCLAQQFSMGGKLGSGQNAPGPRDCPDCYLRAVSRDGPTPPTNFIEVPKTWSLEQFLNNKKKVKTETVDQPTKPVRTAAKSKSEPPEKKRRAEVAETKAKDLMAEVAARQLVPAGTKLPTIAEQNADTEETESAEADWEEPA